MTRARKFDYDAMKIPSPFKLIGSDGDCISFEAVFPLPNDGTGSDNLLVLRVDMDDVDSDTCSVSVIGRTFRDTLIMRSDNIPVKSLGNILYGFATVRTREYLDFN